MPCIGLSVRGTERSRTGRAADFVARVTGRPQHLFVFGWHELFPQHCWLLRQAPVPQHFLPALAQKGVAHDVQQTFVVGQQRPLVPQATVPPLHFCCPAGLAWPAAGLTPIALRIPPASAPPSSLIACRRGCGLASRRAMSSRRNRIFPVLSVPADTTCRCYRVVGRKSIVLNCRIRSDERLTVKTLSPA